MAGRKFRVILIEEGLGNLKDLFYYTREAIESGVSKKLFEGAKCNADHPNAMEEQIQPEGSVRKIIGHYENTALAEGDEGQAVLEADLVILDGPEFDWAVALCERALKVSDKTGKEFIGLSINASGNADTIALAEFKKNATIPKSALPKIAMAEEMGIEEIELCTELVEATSCDLVTQAGAKGRLVKLLETEKFRMAIKKVSKKVKEAKHEGEAGGAGGEQPGHADAAQDKELIKSMLKKTTGKDEHSDEEHEAMEAAHKLACEAGFEGKEAEAAAVAHMKMGAHQAKAESEAEETESESEAEESESESESESEGAAGGDEEEPASGKGAQPLKAKGKMERAIIILKAQNAKLMERFADIDASDLRTKALRESGMGGEALKALDGILRGKKTEASIADAVKTFKEAYGVGAKENPGFIVSHEKIEGQSSAGLSFADCKEE
jgi:hypothetical protein